MSAANQLQELFKSPATAAFNAYSQAVFSSLSRCHTSQMGVHHYRCDQQTCGHKHLQYHSCGNRHCPNCGCMKKEEWVENRICELLPTPYYHVVFTLPHEFNQLIMANRKTMFAMLFSAAAQTLSNHAQNPGFLGAQTGITMVLHTWGQNLSFHPHVHCIVTGGGISQGKWVEAKRKNSKFLFPEISLMKMYKAIFLRLLRNEKELKLQGVNLPDLIATTGRKKWNVYAKAPFGGPAQVIAYLGRYTHKIAITKHRILRITEHRVYFTYRDYAQGNKTKEMSLTHAEFLARFEQHILPKGFVKIRHYGFLQNRNKQTRIAEIRKCLHLEEAKPPIKLPVAIRMLEKFGRDIYQCPNCQTGRLVLVKTTRPYTDLRVKTDLKNKASPAVI